MSMDGSALGYPELLRLAMSKGLQELDAAIVQIPSDQNHGHAVVLAAVRTSTAVYRAVGEAWLESLPQDQRQQALTVAELRAKTRALCEAVGMPQALGASAPMGQAPGARPSHAGGAVTQPAEPEEMVPAMRAMERVATSGSPGVAPVEPDRASAISVTQPASKVESAGPSPSTPMAQAPSPRVPPPAMETEVGVPAWELADKDSQPARPRSQPARPAARPAPVPSQSEGLGPDILQRLLQMTRRKGELEGAEPSEEEAMAKLDSFFQRAFGHPLAEGTRMEGQRVVQRLAADLSRLSQERGDDGAYAAS